MKLHKLNRKEGMDSSFSITRNSYPNFLKIWHYHEELELVFIEESTGTAFIGDSIQKFQPGEVVLMGKNLPHMWLNDDCYFENETANAAQATAIHFKENFMGSDFFDKIEFLSIQKMLKVSARGIKFHEIDSNICQLAHNLSKLDAFQRALRFIELLNFLAQHKKFELLSSLGFMDTFEQMDDERLSKIYKHVHDNFKSDIDLGQTAQIIGMNPSAFSRFFKRIHRKPFTRYVNEIRVGYACKLLMEGDSTVTSAAFESGFNNISNFNRQFKAIKHMSPSGYIKTRKAQE